MSLFLLLVTIYLPFLLLGVVTATGTVQAALPFNSKSVEKRRARDLTVRPQVRKAFPPESDLRALARSVMKRQLHPLIILPGNIILDGECRWRGLMMESAEHEVDVIVVDRELSPAEVCELQMISALHSAVLEPPDQALACSEWMDQNPGATAKELAQKIDRDPSYIIRLLSLFKCIPAVQKAALEERSIGPKAWYQISLLPETEQPGLFEMYRSGMSSAQITEISKTKRNGAPKPEQAAKVAKFKGVMPSGLVVQVNGQEIDIAGLIQLFKDLASQAEKASKEGCDAKAFMALLQARAKDQAKVKK
jgi:hypothetical protein